MRLCQAREEYVRWLGVTRDLSCHTIRAYATDISMLERHLGEKAFVSGLTSARLFTFIEEQRARGLSSTSVRRRVSGLRGFCKWLVARGLLESDPWSDVTVVIRRVPRLPRVLPTQDLARLFRTLHVAANADDLCTVGPHHSFQRTTLLAVSLMLVTGARVSEVVGIKCRDIDISGRSVRILGKGRRERRVFLASDWMCELTAAYLKMRAVLTLEHPYLLFNVNNDPLTPSAMRARLVRVAEDAALEAKLTPHTLRHTAATQLIEAGVDIRYIQRLLGHASLATTEIYTHVSDAALKRVVSNADILGRFATRAN